LRLDDAIDIELNRQEWQVEEKSANKRTDEADNLADEGRRQQ